MLFSKVIDHFKKIDWILVLIPVFLSIFGIVVQYSLVGDSSVNVFNTFIKQILFLVVGVIIMFFMSFYEYQALISKSSFFYIIVLIALALVLIVGSITNGAKSWFDFGFFKLQPVEFLKIIMVLLLSFYWGNHNRKNILFRDILNSLLMISPSLVLILLQPDFGSFILVFLTSLFFIFIINTNIKHYLVFGVMFLLLISCFWLFVFKDYQKDRISSFLNPLSDPLNSGYQVTQSMIAIGSGGFFGKGFGFGAQSQLNFLPEKTNDFVFASFSEEFGFVGVFIVICSYGVLFYRFYYIIKNLEDDASIFVFLGFGFLFLIEILINIGMNIGLAPVTGISLPFISYGGSGLVSNFIILGILQNIVVAQKKF